MTDDPALAQLLRRAGLPDDLGELDACWPGSTPLRARGQDDAWLELVGQDLPDALGCRAAGTPRGLAAGHSRPARSGRGSQGLRRVLRERGVDGFVLMRTDEHGSEYLPGYAERVAWLTGFTGSAAQAAVLMDRATVLSDGRYTVQLEQQVDDALFERRHLVEQPLSSLAGGASAARRAAGVRSVARPPGRARSPGSGREGQGRHAGGPRPQPGRCRLVRSAAAADRPGAGCTTSAMPARAVPTSGSGSAASSPIRRRICCCSRPRTSIAWLLNVRGGDISFNPLVLSYLLLDRTGSAAGLSTPANCPRDCSCRTRSASSRSKRSRRSCGRLHGRTVLADPAATHVGFLERLKSAGAKLVEADDPCVLAKAQKNPIELRGAADAQRREEPRSPAFWPGSTGQPLDGSVDEAGAADRLEQERAKDPLFRGPASIRSRPTAPTPPSRTTG